MPKPDDVYGQTFEDLVVKAAQHPLESQEATTAFKNLKTFSESRPPVTEPLPAPEPTTVWGKVKAGTVRALDNETTRTLIKAGGAFAGVALVAYATVYKDHVVERQALAQANQRNS